MKMPVETPLVNQMAGACFCLSGTLNAHSDQTVSDGSLWWQQQFVYCLPETAWMVHKHAIPAPCLMGMKKKMTMKMSNIITQYDTLWDKLLVSQVPQLPAASGLGNLTRLCLALPSLVVSYQVPYWALARQICVITLLTLGTFLTLNAWQNLVLLCHTHAHTGPSTMVVHMANCCPTLHLLVPLPPSSRPSRECKLWCKF